MTQEILIAVALAGLLDLLVLLALIVYERKLTASALRLVIAALAFQLVCQGLQIGAMLTAAPLLMLTWALARAGYVILMLLALRRSMRSGRAGEIAGVCITFMLALHIGLDAYTLMNGSDISGSIIVLADSILALLVAAVFLLLELDRGIKALVEKEEKLQQYEQSTRRLELQFAQAQKHESLGVMAAGIAHDFNNLLTSILGYTSLAIRKLPADSEVRKDLYMVMSGGRQAVELTTEMLTYAGKGNLEFEPVNLSRLVDSMAGLVNSLVPKRIHLTQNIPEGLPMVRGDAVLLGQVLVNLVGNAVDATAGEGGTIEIATGIKNVKGDVLARSLFADRHESGVYVYLEVTDSGVGMAADRVEKIFDPFYSEKNQGKGLGLSAISGIVRQHRGFMTVDTEPGAGSSFRVFLPMVIYKDPAQPGQGSASGLEAASKVLLADDDVGIRSLIETLLTEEGFAVVSAVDGREALDEIERSGREISLFMLDCTMPRLTGIELYREIRTSGLQTPLILISGYHEGRIVDEISNDPAARFLRKPFSVDQLLEVVRSFPATQPQTG